MKRFWIFTITVFSTCVVLFLTEPKPMLPTAVSYTFSGGRSGDNLIAYARAKWIAYLYKLPLLYRPFPHSDEMYLEENETLLTRELQKKYTKKIIYNSHIQLDEKPDTSFLRNLPYMPDLGFTMDPSAKLRWTVTQLNQSVLYWIPYFPEVNYEHHPKQDYVFFQVDWKDPEFRKILLNAIRPKQKFLSLSLPKDKHCVAVHIRTGRGHDSEEMHKLDPLKFPPITFYVAQIKELSKILNHESLHVQIFTDDPYPQELAQKIKDRLKAENVEIHYFSKKRGILEDFFALQEFDYLIRSNSNFSILASLLKDYRICLSPSHYSLEEKMIVIDSVNCSIMKKN